MAVSEEPSQQAVAVAATALAVGCRRAAPCGCAERFVLCVLVGVLFAVVELLLERPGLLLVGERQASQTVLELESVEERPILVVGKRVVNLLIPQNTTIRGRDIHELDEVGVAHEIIGEDRSALTPCAAEAERILRVVLD